MPQTQIKGYKCRFIYFSTDADTEKQQGQGREYYLIPSFTNIFPLRSL